MPSTDRRLTVTTDVDPAILEPVLRAGLVVGVLFLVGALVALLPGASRELPGTAVTLGGLLTATVTLAVVGALVLATTAVEVLVRGIVSGPDETVGDLAGAARYGVVFVAVLVAYGGLAPAVLPLLAPGAAWMYDVAFLGFALFPLLAAGRRLYRSADGVASELARVVTQPGPGRTEVGSGTGGDR